MLKTAPIQIRNNARGDENVQAEAESYSLAGTPHMNGRSQRKLSLQ